MFLRHTRIEPRAGCKRQRRWCTSPQPGARIKRTDPILMRSLMRIRLPKLLAIALTVAAVCATGSYGAKPAKTAKAKGVHGKVASVDAAAKSFVVSNKKRGNVTVTTSAATTFKKDD